MFLSQFPRTSTWTLDYGDANWLVEGALERIQQDLTSTLSFVSRVTNSPTCPRAYGALVPVPELHGLLDAPALSEDGVDLGLVLHLPAELEAHMMQMVSVTPQWHVLPNSNMSGHRAYLSWQATAPTFKFPVTVLVSMESLLPVIGVLSSAGAMQLAHRAPKSLPLVLVPAQRQAGQSVVVADVRMDLQLRSRCLMGLRAQTRAPDATPIELAHAQAAALLHSDLHWLFKTHTVLSRDEYIAAIAAPVIPLHSPLG